MHYSNYYIKAIMITVISKNNIVNNIPNKENRSKNHKIEIY